MNYQLTSLGNLLLRTFKQIAPERAKQMEAEERLTEYLQEQQEEVALWIARMEDQGNSPREARSAAIQEWSEMIQKPEPLDDQEEADENGLEAMEMWLTAMGG